MNSLKYKLNLAHCSNSKKIKINEDNTIVQSNDIRLHRECFNITCYDLANFLLGKIIVHKIENVLVKGRIVETECYPGGVDKASHSYNGRRTPGNEPMYMEAGTAYVYKIYGMYHCFNISSIESGGAVLIRALEPLNGVDTMQQFQRRSRSKEIKVFDLCRGPSKLCISMNITKENCNKIDLCTSLDIWLEFDRSFTNFETVCSTRIGIRSAGEEWANKLMRFYVKKNLCVSKRDRKREKSVNI